MSLFGRTVGLVLLVGFGANASQAGVENTHHDMRLYNPMEEKSVCVYCHVPHGASAEKLLARKGVLQNELGVVGAFCYSCHDGTVVPSALIEAPDGTLGIEALTRSHGLKVGDIWSATGGLEGPDAVRRSGLVPVDPSTGNLPDRMECTACHNPHDASNPPFLKAPLKELCQKCHSGRDGKGGGRFGTVEDAGSANGPHPVGMPVADSGKDRRRPEQAQPERVFNDVDSRLRVPGLRGAELGDPTRHWTTGGHLADLGSDPKVGAVTCSTCHSAHAVTDKLLVFPSFRTASGDDPLCAGCHGAKGSPQNPGGTPFYHPAEGESVRPYATSTSPSRELLIAIPGDWPVGKDGALLCATCHRAHQGREGSKCLRSNLLGKKYVCDLCHPADEDVTTLTPKENSHHLTSRVDKSAVLEGRTLSWSRGAGEPGDLSDGLTCIDCHVELSKSAHNW